jgi:hypothetical protein
MLHDYDYVEFWHGQVKRKGTINACFPNSDTYNIVPDGRKYEVTIPEHKIVDRVDMNDFFKLVKDVGRDFKIKQKNYDT